jgi:hypothetical protein
VHLADARINTTRLQVKYPVKVQQQSSNATANDINLPPVLSVDEARLSFHTQQWAGSASLHLLSNRALSACSSSFPSTCMSTLWPDGELGGVDILFLEFGVNDYAIIDNNNKTDTAVPGAPHGAGAVDGC